MRRAHAMPFGATPTSGGVRFRLWAPGARSVELALGGDADRGAWQPVPAAGDGWYEITTSRAQAGTRYRYRVDAELTLPDPAARYNPDDVHGASEVIDPGAYAWRDAGWAGRPWHEAVIYELHVGTFTAAGTFGGVADRLDHLVALGVTAIELMPVADFPGARGWGYDGVLAFAPDAGYGTPADLKSLIDAAHARRLMVLVDVVYNHFGPEGNYLARLAPEFFTARHQTPWGSAINFDGEGSRTVRDFFIHNALYWLDEFHADGLRLDAVHAIVDDSSPDFLTELAATVRAGPGRDRHVHLVLENDRNEALRLARDATRRPRHFTAQWNDDFHHVVHHLVTGETGGYYADYTQEPLAALGRALAEGFVYQGGASAYRGGARRGQPSAALPPEAFVNFIQNHDQVGNRAFGERIGALAPAGALRAALAILLLAPSPPLLFMGEEFAADSPFLYFCDFDADLARAVREGRRAEFASMPAYGDDTAARSIPDPGLPATAVRSTLDWSQPARDPHAGWLAFYRQLLAIRADTIVPLVPRIVPGAARHWMIDDSTLAVRWAVDDGRVLALDAQRGAHAGSAVISPGAIDVWKAGESDGGGWRIHWRIEPRHAG
jgi:maltooligosyltrehalose trehalohydrolase